MQVCGPSNSSSNDTNANKVKGKHVLQLQFDCTPFTAIFDCQWREIDRMKHLSQFLYINHKILNCLFYSECDTFAELCFLHLMIIN